MTSSVKVKILTSFSEKLIGLIGEKNIYPVYFETYGAIHTFGMRSVIDVVILDKNNKVVKIKKELKPNKLFFWNPKYKRVLELPTGTMKLHPQESVKLISQKSRPEDGFKQSD